MLAPKECSIEVSRQHRMPTGQRYMLWVMRDEAIFKACDAGVVDHNIDPAVIVQNTVYNRSPLRFFADVQMQVRRAGSREIRNFGTERIIDVDSL
jgi:hypothetical protein